MINKTFDIDLASLYEYIGNSETKYGYHIEHSKNSDCDYYDLGSYSTPILACDGETCKVTDIHGDCIVIYNEYCPIKPGFYLSIEEFEIVCH